MQFIAFSIIISNRGYTETTISKLEPDTPAIESGLQVGDKILTIDGARVFTIQMYQWVFNFLREIL